MWRTHILVFKLLCEERTFLSLNFYVKNAHVYIKDVLAQVHILKEMWTSHNLIIQKSTVIALS